MTHLHLLSSGVHQLSDKVYGCRFPANMDLLCTETYTNPTKKSTAKVGNIIKINDINHKNKEKN